MNHEHHDFLYTFIHTLVAIHCSTSRMRPSWPHPWVRLSPSLAHTHLVPSLFVLAHPTACCLLQQLIFHTCNPPLTTRQFNTFVQVNIMCVQYNIYNRHIHSSQLFFLCLLLISGQASWPQTFMPGTGTTESKLSIVNANAKSTLFSVLWTWTQTQTRTGHGYG
jgi:hypothetical protein